MRLADILLLALVAGLVIAAVCAMRQRKKRGKHISCGGDCSHCAMGCGRKQENGIDETIRPEQ